MKKILFSLTILLFTKYNFVTSQNVWIQKANFGGTARWAATGFAIGNKGYIGTGNDAVLSNELWEYDQPTNSWTQKANFGGAARWAAVGFSIGTKGYIGTGNISYSRANPQQDFWEYDQLTDTWAQKANFPGIGR